MRDQLDRQSPRGQTIVMVGVGLVALVAMVGLVIDVGLQWADNRGSQNGTDAAAEAGAVVLMEYLLGATHTDADVLDAINTVATVNGVDTVVTAEYTDWQGTVIGDVGAGSIPPGAQGVRVVGERTHQTVFARIVGINELSARTEAIAVTGPAELCPADDPCAFLPVTIPTTVVTCDGQNKSVPTLDDWQRGIEYTIPLCGKNPGSVGWIDWDPPGGGDTELAAELCNPNPPYPVILPDWFWVTSAGNTNSKPVDDCFASHIGEVVVIPLFEDTCASDPGDATECTDPAPIGGINQWYYFPRAASLLLTGVYVNGNHSAECDSGNGATSCFTGTFIDPAITGEVSGPFDPSDPSLSRAMTVQLIR